jgi:hypothetical protein
MQTERFEAIVLILAEANPEILEGKGIGTKTARWRN